MYNEILDGDFVHNDDVRVVGKALNAVNFIAIDYNAVAARNRGYIKANIARRVKREASIAKGAMVAALLASVTL